MKELRESCNSLLLFISTGPLLTLVKTKPRVQELPVEEAIS